MLELDISFVDWRTHPEIATLLYNSFPNRTKRDLRDCAGPEYLWIGAYHYGSFAGMAGIATDPYLIEHAPTRIAWVAVTSCFRRFRVATNLLSYISTLWNHTYLFVDEYNTSAKRLYEKCGYVVYKKHRGPSHPGFWMEKKFLENIQQEDTD